MSAPADREPLQRLLVSLQAAGVRRIPRGRAGPGGRPGAEGTAGGAAPAGGDEAAHADAAARLAAIAAEVCACELCPLSATRTRAVPGEGAPSASIVFVGEGPGADEDRSGRPFVGRAGRLLDDIITKGMRMRREDVFICNVVKCRPPGNRVPAPEEVAACAPYLERQLRAIAPRVVCALGATAIRRLVDTDEPMGRLRGRVLQAWGIPVIPTYHPAYLLRNPAAKRAVWEDIQKVMELAKGP